MERAEQRHGADGLKPAAHTRRSPDREAGAKNMEIRDANGHVISDWRDWPRPKKPSQWRAARSAMELARSWFTSPYPCVPSEVASLLGTSPLTAGMTVEYARPECVTALPKRGEGRNHDLVMVGRSKKTRVTVCVEAKADESFGEVIGAYLRQTVQKAEAEHRPTGLPARVEALLGLVFGTAADSGVDTMAGHPVPTLDGRCRNFDPGGRGWR